jgi:hypothetical protein
MFASECGEEESGSGGYIRGSSSGERATGVYFKDRSIPRFSYHNAPCWVMSDKDLARMSPDFTPTDW